MFNFSNYEILRENMMKKPETRFWLKFFEYLFGKASKNDQILNVIKQFRKCSDEDVVMINCSKM